MTDLKEKILKIMELNEYYTVSFSLPSICGYGNFLTGRGHICLSNSERGICIDVYNTNQYGYVYSEHGVYTFFIDKSGNIIEKTEYGEYPEKIKFYKSREIFTGSLPTGWRAEDPDGDSDTEKGYRHLISILKAFGAQCCSYEPVY